MGFMDSIKGAKDKAASLAQQAKNSVDNISETKKNNSELKEKNIENVKNAVECYLNEISSDISSLLLKLSLPLYHFSVYKKIDFNIWDILKKICSDESTWENELNIANLPEEYLKAYSEFFVPLMKKVRGIDGYESYVTKKILFVTKTDTSILKEQCLNYLVNWNYENTNEKHSSCDISADEIKRLGYENFFSPENLFYIAKSNESNSTTWQDAFEAINKQTVLETQKIFKEVAISKTVSAINSTDSTTLELLLNNMIYEYPNLTVSNFGKRFDIWRILNSMVCEDERFEKMLPKALYDKNPAIIKGVFAFLAKATESSSIFDDTNFDWTILSNTVAKTPKYHADECKTGSNVNDKDVKILFESFFKPLICNLKDMDEIEKTVFNNVFESTKDIIQVVKSTIKNYIFKWNYEIHISDYSSIEINDFSANNIANTGVENYYTPSKLFYIIYKRHLGNSTSIENEIETVTNQLFNSLKSIKFAEVKKKMGGTIGIIAGIKESNKDGVTCYNSIGKFNIGSDNDYLYILNPKKDIWTTTEQLFRANTFYTAIPLEKILYYSVNGSVSRQTKIHGEERSLSSDKKTVFIKPTTSSTIEIDSRSITLFTKSWIGNLALSYSSLLALKATIPQKSESMVNEIEKQKYLGNTQQSPQVILQQKNEPDALAQLEKLAQLKESGIISEEDFNAKKSDLLAKI